MATLSLSSSYNFSSSLALSWTTESATASTITFTSGSYRAVAGGSFAFDSGGNVFGTGTSINFYSSNSLVYALTGLSVDANQVQQLYDSSASVQTIASYFLQNADVITGSSGSDYLLGFAGNDTITGGAGNETVDGGSGTDVFVVSGARASYTLTPVGSSFTLTANSGTDGVDSLSNVEQLQFSDQTLTLETYTTTSGTSSNDTLTGSSVADAISGGSGNDSIDGGSGNDSLTGGSGNDTVISGAGNDIIAGMSGSDAVYGGDGTDVLLLSSASTQCTVAKLRSDTFMVRDSSGNLSLCRGVEQIQFSDTTSSVSSLSTYGNVDSTLAQIYVAAFRRAPELSGYNYWKQEATSQGLSTVANTIFSLDVVKAIYSASMSSSDFVTAIYSNVFNRSPDTDGLNYWASELARTSRGALVISMTNAALSVPDGTSGKDYFQNRLDWSLYSVGYQAATSEMTTSHLSTLTSGVSADVSTVVTLIGQAMSGVTI